MKFKTVKIYLLSIVLSLVVSCQKGVQSGYVEDKELRDLLIEMNESLTETILFDGFSPPVASRIYAYPNLAAYETLQYGHEAFKAVTPQLNGFSGLPENPDLTLVFLPFSAIVAFEFAGKELTYRKFILEQVSDSLKIHLQKKYKLSGRAVEASVAFGKEVALHILNRAKNDGYAATRTMPLFQYSQSPAKWKPTPPTYMPAIEPHWNKIKPFVLSSADQIPPPPPSSFSTDTNSIFYKEAMQVYHMVNNIDDEKLAIAKHWDCNPYISINVGHLMYKKRQITPGGHWISIAGIAAKSAGLDMLETSETLMLASIALFDGFISCWDEKYRSNLIRPETYINEYFDPRWKPLLETPAFPEHTSGHSVISSAAATILTHIHGEPFGFTDSTNVRIGLPPRSYGSFNETSDEAAISRLYGGIHYYPAIEYGISQGKQVGDIIHKTIQTRKSEVYARTHTFDDVKKLKAETQILQVEHIPQY